MPSMPPQQRIDEVQHYYRAWLLLQDKLKQAEQDWQLSVALLEKMQKFYFDEFQAISDKIDEGLAVNLTTQGEYSIMSQDTIWQAIHTQQQALWRMMRFAVDNLDPSGS